MAWRHVLVGGWEKLAKGGYAVGGMTDNKAYHWGYNKAYSTYHNLEGSPDATTWEDTFMSVFQTGLCMNTCVRTRMCVCVCVCAC